MIFFKKNKEIGFFDLIQFFYFHDFFYLTCRWWPPNTCNFQF